MVRNSSPLRTRPVSAGALRTFEAVARHLNFRAAAAELALTQPAVSRQIQALEDEVGVRLFLRHTRAVELTGAGALLLGAVTHALPRIDAAVRQVRQTAGRRIVALSTFASFASLWLIPRMEQFQRDHPDIDIRIDATDTPVDMDVADVDLALRHGPDATMPPGATRLFGEEVTPLASPWLLRSAAPLRDARDLLRFALIEDALVGRQEWLTWRHWFDQHGFAALQPKRWLYFNYSYQMVQAALSGQGIVLARLPLVAENVARGELVEVLPGLRIVSPWAYWLVPGPRARPRPEIEAFGAWLLAQAEVTRHATGEAAASVSAEPPQGD
ncbi:LysR family transcriptional regulator [Ramlibacter sp. RBP-2]|uniref:LysR family transcriptional regulator n=1 Tax=Ramlibacter lithotrophicus TaxID=2606681 RepID=A0A7X6DG65_9BURK|nr:LysR family transcriptional regulator [Ramlibacter lithotrophicus]